MADSSLVAPSEVQTSVANGDGAVLEEKESTSEDIPGRIIPRKSSVLKKDGKSSKRALQKSVSFIARPEDKRIINGESERSIFLYLSCFLRVVNEYIFVFLPAADCLTFMQNGSELMKIRSNSRQYQRFFYLDEDLSSLRWRPSSKKPDKARSECCFVVLIRIIDLCNTLYILCFPTIFSSCHVLY